MNVAKGYTKEQKKYKGIEYTHTSWYGITLSYTIDNIEFIYWKDVERHINIFTRIKKLERLRVV